MHRTAKSLVTWASLRLQAYHVESELLALDDAFYQIREVMLAPSSQEDSQSILLFTAESHELYLNLVNRRHFISSLRILFAHSTSPPSLEVLLFLSLDL